MKTFIYSCCLFFYATIIFGGCDPTKFRWGCEMYPDVVNKHKESYLIYCGTTRLHVNKNQFAMLERYQRAGVTMHLLINDIYYDGPCIPAMHNIIHQRPYRF
jgi:hypothetical protein